MQKIKRFNIEHILTLTPISFVPNRTDTPELGNNCSTGAPIFAGVDSTKIDGWGIKSECIRCKLNHVYSKVQTKFC